MACIPCCVPCYREGREEREGEGSEGVREGDSEGRR